MKHQGADGVSRGNLKEGVSLGSKMLQFCPWYLSALEQEPKLAEWLRSWMPSHVEFLEPKDWFLRGHDLQGGSDDAKGYWRHGVKAGNFVWVPPPAAAHVCLEELRKARIKRQSSLHVVIIPRLMTPLWLKQLFKTADLIVNIVPEYDYWSSSQFEPLTVAICFPYLNFSPWQLRSTPQLCRMAREVRKVQKEKIMDPGRLLRKLLLRIRRLPTLQPHVVRKMLYLESGSGVSDSRNKSALRPKRKRPSTSSMEARASKPRSI